MNKHLLIIFVSLIVCLGVQDSLLAQSNSQVGITPTEISLDELKVYPNPTTDYFQISNGLNVKKVIIFNMFGKEVKSFFPFTITTKERLKKIVDEFDELIRIKDIQGNEINVSEYETRKQFREFFVQKLQLDANVLPNDTTLMNMRKPIFDELQPIYKDDASDDYWMNTPLPNIHN